MIYTVTCNPALDYVMELPGEFQSGRTNRSSQEEIYCGGKGINVSQVCRELGADSIALGFIAGFTGDALEAGAGGLGIRTELIRLERGMTRINVKLKGQQETEINAAGPVVDRAAAERLLNRVAGLQARDVLVLSGSLPASLPAGYYGRLLEAVSGKQVLTVLDTSGEPFLQALEYKPFLVKPNEAELGAYFGTGPVEEPEEIFAYARRLQSMGARNVLVSRGSKGLAFVSEDGFQTAMPALQGHAVNTVGAGDSMVAGVLYGLLQSGESQVRTEPSDVFESDGIPTEKSVWSETLKWGLAAASATAFSAGLGTGEEIRGLYQSQK